MSTLINGSCDYHVTGYAVQESKNGAIKEPVSNRTDVIPHAGICTCTIVSIVYVLLYLLYMYYCIYCICTIVWLVLIIHHIL